jgi:hypothetical protein
MKVQRRRTQGQELGLAYGKGLVLRNVRRDRV